MDKVNNMSLRDINRFQFRKGRPSEPGFPVQQAGSKDLPSSSSAQKLGTSNVKGIMLCPVRIKPDQESRAIG